MHQPPCPNEPGTPLRPEEHIDQPFESEATAAYLDHTTTYMPGCGGYEGLPAVPGYEILSELGRGGMGIVYKARQVRLDRVVALKTVSSPLPGAAMRQRFEDEAKAVARFDHPNLVRVFDSGETAGRPWFALELVEGGTLAQALRRGPWQPRPAARLVAVLADAVEYAHQRGVVHRDLKPANVLLQKSSTTDHTEYTEKEEKAGQDLARLSSSVPCVPWLNSSPKIADFGLARLLEAEPGVRTQPGCCLGTPRYMPPEQASGLSGSSGRAADVFGLGAILYELLTGQAPFVADSLEETLNLARRGEVKRPRAVNRHIPAELERICLKALARQPERRHATAGELARELRNYLARRRRRLVVGAAFVAVLLLVGLGWLLRGRSASPPPHEPAVPLSGELIVTITSKDGARKRGLRVDQPGALPARAGEGFQVEARLNQPAHVYLILLSSQGEVVPLYPWNADEIAQQKFAPVPPQEPSAVIHSPTSTDGEWQLDAHDGLETVLLLARKTPLPGDVNLARLIGPPPRVELLNPLEWALRGGDAGQKVDSLDLGSNRGIERVARRRDDPLLKIMSRLRAEFEVIRAVRFAHRGK